MSNFSDHVIALSGPHWQQATNHPFIQEMVDNTLDKQKFSRYLIQDYAFVNAFVGLISYSAAYAKTMAQKHRLSTFLSMVTSEENDYFIRSFRALDVAETDYLNSVLSPAMQGFHDVIEKVIHSDTLPYESCIMAFACAEMVYCEWGVRHLDKRPKAFYFNEWLILHNNDDFQAFVTWLRAEVDSFSILSAEHRQDLSDIFVEMCTLEAKFFDECYA